MTELHILQPGIASTIQDHGRQGTLHLGIPTAGAMDPYSLAAGRYRLGHQKNEAAIEIPYGNFIARPTESCEILVTGAPTELHIDGEAVDPRNIQLLAKGQTLAIGPTSRAVYCYLHIAGGIATKPFLGSRSTSTREGIGGLDGRVLRAGDYIPLAKSSATLRSPDPAMIVPVAPNILRLRFVPGFQYDILDGSARKALESNTFHVTSKSNRMGISLSGEPIETGIESLLSESTCHGAIQIPPNGQPIVLMADRQTVGGYPKPGAVIESDCVRLAQARPGQLVCFDVCTPMEADRIRWLEENYLEERLC